MNRRALLAAVGPLSIAGCLAAVEPPRAGSVDHPDRCPAFDEDVVRVVCTGTRTPEDAPVVVERSRKRGELPTATLSFTLRNASSRDFTTNFWEWHVHKYVDGAWFHVAPRYWHVPAMGLAPGEGHTWTLAVDNTRLDGSPLPVARGTEAVDLAGLGGGQYAFGTTGWFADEDHEHQTGVAATFELDGPRIDLRPTDEVIETWRDDEVVTVRVDRGLEEADPATYTVTRVTDPPEEPRRLIVEQVLRDTPLRDALAHFEPGVRTVHLRSETTTFPAFGIDDPWFVAYDGRTYRIETERRETND